MALVGGLLPPAIVALYYSIALGLNPLHGAWYLLMSVMGGTPSLATLLVWVALAAAFAAVARSVLVADPEDERPERRPAARGAQLRGAGLAGRHRVGHPAPLVLVAGQPLDGAALGVQQLQPLPGGDLPDPGQLGGTLQLARPAHQQLVVVAGGGSELRRHAGRRG